MALSAEYRRREEARRNERLWFWFLVSVGAHLFVLLALLLSNILIPTPPPEQDRIEFTIVDPNEIEPPDTELRANNNSEDGGEATPEETSAGRPSSSAAPPVANQAPPQPAPAPPPPPPAPPAPVQQAAAPPAPVIPPKPVETVPPPPPAPPAPDPEPLPEREIAQAPVVPAPTPRPTPVPTPPPTPRPTLPPTPRPTLPPTPRPTPPPISTPVPTPPPIPQTRQPNSNELAAAFPSRPIAPPAPPRPPTPPQPPAPATRDSVASQLGGPISTNTNRGAGGTASSSALNPSRSATAPPSVAARAEVNWGPYLAQLQRAVEQHWIPGQSNSSRRTVVLFTIGRSGQVSNVRLAASSGNQQTDAAAISAVQIAAPFLPLPAAYDGSSIDIHFTFDLTVSGGRLAFP